MSGGSYNYLCWNTESLSERRYDLQSMVERLEGLAWAAQAAAASRRVLTLLDEAQQLAGSLTDAWHAIEWWDSCDWVEQGAREEVEGYEPPDGMPIEDVLYRLVDVGGKVYKLCPVTRDNGPTTPDAPTED